MDRLDQPRACDLKAARAKAELALAHVLHVVLAAWEVLVDLDFTVLVLPMVKQDLPDVPMRASGEEGKDAALARWQPKMGYGDIVKRQFELRE